MMHAFTYLSIVLDVPIFRQVLSFIYLTFIPGFVILRVIGGKQRSLGRTFLLSTGLSTASLMFIGLTINQLLPLFAVQNPLSTTPLLVILFSITLALSVVGYRKELTSVMKIDLFTGLNAKVVLLCATLSFVPVLAIVGAIIDNSLLLLSMILSIVALYSITLFSDKATLSKLHLLIIFAVSLALLFHVSLVTKHLMGWDTFAEYYVFKITANAGHWAAPGSVAIPSVTSIMNSVASITILPTIYSQFLSLDGEGIFKIIFPLVFSLVPLALYEIYRLQTRKSVAILSTFLFVSSSINFYGVEMLSLGREMVGELFFVVAILTLVDRSMSSRERRILFIIFSAALVVSHYTLSYLFLFYIISTFIILHMRGKSKVLSLGLVLILIATTFSWNIYVSDAPLIKLGDVFRRMVDRFATDIFSTSARFQPGVTPLSPTAQTNLVGLTHKILVYVVNLFIGIGAVILVFKPKKFDFQPEFRLMGILSAFILLLALTVPNFAPTLNLTRFYQIVMLLLAPLFTLGGEYLLKSIRGVMKLSIPFLGRLGKFFGKEFELRTLTIVLIAFFLFQVGFINHITEGYPYSYSLDFDRKKISSDFGVRSGLYSIYVPEYDFASAQWLYLEMANSSRVYADGSWGKPILAAYALLAYERVDYLYNTTELESKSYIYLRYLNIREGLIYTATDAFNLTDISNLLDHADEVYSNGGSEVRIVP
jgi:uncharacterized membrane protein